MTYARSNSQSIFGETLGRILYSKRNIQQAIPEMTSKTHCLGNIDKELQRPMSADGQQPQYLQSLSHTSHHLAHHSSIINSSGTAGIITGSSSGGGSSSGSSSSSGGGGSGNNSSNIINNSNNNSNGSSSNLHTAIGSGSSSSNGNNNNGSNISINSHHHPHGSHIVSPIRSIVGVGGGGGGGGGSGGSSSSNSNNGSTTAANNSNSNNNNNNSSSGSGGSGGSSSNGNKAHSNLHLHPHPHHHHHHHHHHHYNNSNSNSSNSSNSNSSSNSGINTNTNTTNNNNSNGSNSNSNSSSPHHNSLTASSTTMTTGNGNGNNNNNNNNSSNNNSNSINNGKVSPKEYVLTHQNQIGNVILAGVPIVSLFIDSKERLCLAQISNTLLNKYSYNEIHNRRVALGITCVQCTPVQLEMLRRAGAMPVSSRRCGMITKREAERLVRSFLEENTPPKLPEDFSFNVYHECGWGCQGNFHPSRYNSSRAKCIKCNFCNLFFSPNKFIFHFHRTANSKYNHPDAANFNSWRRHLKLYGASTEKEEIVYAWEDVKAMFNGGGRRRFQGSTSNTHNPKSIGNSVEPAAKRTKLDCGSDIGVSRTGSTVNTNNASATVKERSPYPMPDCSPFSMFSNHVRNPSYQTQASYGLSISSTNNADQLIPTIANNPWASNQTNFLMATYDRFWASQLGLTRQTSEYQNSPYFTKAIPRRDIKLSNEVSKPLNMTPSSSEEEDSGTSSSNEEDLNKPPTVGHRLSAFRPVNPANSRPKSVEELDRTPLDMKRIGSSLVERSPLMVESNIENSYDAQDDTCVEIDVLDEGDDKCSQSDMVKDLCDMRAGSRTDMDDGTDVNGIDDVIDHEGRDDNDDDDDDDDDEEDGSDDGGDHGDEDIVNNDRHRDDGEGGGGGGGRGRGHDEEDDVDDNDNENNNSNNNDDDDDNNNDNNNNNNNNNNDNNNETDNANDVEKCRQQNKDRYKLSTEQHQTTLQRQTSPSQQQQQQHQQQQLLQQHLSQQQHKQPQHPQQSHQHHHQQQQQQQQILLQQAHHDQQAQTPPPTLMLSSQKQYKQPQSQQQEHPLQQQQQQQQQQHQHQQQQQLHLHEQHLKVEVSDDERDVRSMEYSSRKRKLDVLKEIEEGTKLKAETKRDEMSPLPKRGIGVRLGGGGDVDDEQEYINDVADEDDEEEEEDADHDRDDDGGVSGARGRGVRHCSGDNEEDDEETRHKSMAEAEMNLGNMDRVGMYHPHVRPITEKTPEFTVNNRDHVMQDSPTIDVKSSPIPPDILTMTKEQLHEQLLQEIRSRRKIEKECQIMKDTFQEQVKQDKKHREDMQQQIHLVQESLTNELDQERKARLTLQEKLKVLSFFSFTEAHDALHSFSCKMLAPRFCGECNYKDGPGPIPR